MDILAEQGRLIDGVARALAARYGRVEQFETHASRVLVAGGAALKFKKAVRLPFLDFSTLAARRFFCEEECRLNRRLAPRIYVGVARVSGTPQAPQLDGPGEALEYAVRMHAFAQQDLWGSRVASARLGGADIDALAQALARFHLDAAPAPADSEWGSVQIAGDAFRDTLSELAGLPLPPQSQDDLAALGAWEGAQRERHGKSFGRRKARGMVR